MSASVSVVWTCAVAVGTLNRAVVIATALTAMKFRPNDRDVKLCSEGEGVVRVIGRPTNSDLVWISSFLSLAAIEAVIATSSEKEEDKNDNQNDRHGSYLFELYRSDLNSSLPERMSWILLR
jgi:hypothetical protein